MKRWRLHRTIQISRQHEGRDFPLRANPKSDSSLSRKSGDEESGAERGQAISTSQCLVAATTPSSMENPNGCNQNAERSKDPNLLATKHIPSGSQHTGGSLCRANWNRHIKKPAKAMCALDRWINADPGLINPSIFRGCSLKK